MFQKYKGNEIIFFDKNRYFLGSEVDETREKEWLKATFGGWIKQLFEFLNLMPHSEPLATMTKIIVQTFVIFSGIYPLISICMLEIKVTVHCSVFCEESELRENILLYSFFSFSFIIASIMISTDNSLVESSWVSLNSLDFERIHKSVSTSLWIHRPIFLFPTVFGSTMSRDFPLILSINLKEGNLNAAIAIGLLTIHRALVIMYFVSKTEEVFGYIVLVKHTQNMMIKNLEKNSIMNDLNIDRFRLVHKKFATFTQACDAKCKYFLLFSYPILMLCSILQLYFMLTMQNKQPRRIVALTGFLSICLLLFFLISFASMSVNSGSDRISRIIQKRMMKQKDPIFLLKVGNTILTSPVLNWSKYSSS